MTSYKRALRMCAALQCRLSTCHVESSHVSSAAPRPSRPHYMRAPLTYVYVRACDHVVVCGESERTPQGERSGKEGSGVPWGRPWRRVFAIAKGQGRRRPGYKGLGTASARPIYPRERAAAMHSLLRLAPQCFRICLVMS